VDCFFFRRFFGVYSRPCTRFNFLCAVRDAVRRRCVLFLTTLPTFFCQTKNDLRKSSAEESAMRNRLMRQLVLSLLCCFLLNTGAFANQWVYGTVSSLEDYGSFTVDSNPFEVLVGLNASNWVNPADAPICNQRFRIVVGLQNVTADMKNRFFALLLSAYHTGASVRLFYSTAGAPYCQVQIASIGNF
jgi:hypothetical protein